MALLLARLPTRGPGSPAADMLPKREVLLTAHYARSWPARAAAPNASGYTMYTIRTGQGARQGNSGRAVHGGLWISEIRASTRAEQTTGRLPPRQSPAESPPLALASGTSDGDPTRAPLSHFFFFFFAPAGLVPVERMMEILLRRPFTLLLLLLLRPRRACPGGAHDGDPTARSFHTSSSSSPPPGLSRWSA
jgi:hypothetical protein